ncbi:6-bladed beta-propeller [uncultured Algoriphagus sp.]|uniref:6-bladed beta-propeller n=1 Tax=uncultured Algoriphagus sp. TaxID=417365 RepID=UPI0030EBADBA
MKYYYFLVVVLICACKGGSQNVIEFYDANIGSNDLSQIFEVKSFVPLSIPDSINFGIIQDVQYTNDEIIVLENGLNNSILFFDSLGHFTRQLSKLGNGPGEYIEIEFFTMTGTSVVLYDRNQSKLIYYDLRTLNYISETKLDFLLVGGLGLTDDQLLLISDSQEKTGYIFYQASTDSFDHFPQSPGVIEGYIPQAISTDLLGQGYLTQAFTEQVYKIRNNALALEFRIDFGSKSIPTTVLETSDANDFYDILSSGAYYFAAHNILKNENFVAFNFFNENIENVELGLVDLNSGETLRYSPDSHFDYVIMRPLSVRRGEFQTVLLPEEVDPSSLLNLGIKIQATEYPILVSYVPKN